VYGRAKLGDGEHPIIARVDGRRPPVQGEVLHVTPRRGHVHLFDVASGERLG
jgi:multiple sugar transport system ATP-binding protein